LELLRRPDERARLGANARRAALASYDVPIIAARLASLYCEAMQISAQQSAAPPRIA
jgi:glycosyltransferase involved in cell wall biosynthesis